MKTKIIYISGAEVFNMRDVRAAFEEVRRTLNLGPDTVMFGVPVDADDAIGTDVATDAIVDTVDTVDMVDVAAPVAVLEPDVAETEIPSVADVVPDPVIAADEPIAEPVAPKKRGRAKKKTAVADVPDAAPVAVDEVIASDTPDAVSDTPDVSEVPDAAPIPILSVLASNVSVDSSVADTDVISDEVAADDTASAVEIIETVEIEDIVSDEEPVDATAEKTLEELLESMAPLSEDKDEPDDDAVFDDNAPDQAPIIDNTDATLEQLAAEFVQNEDKIESSPRTTGRGKIGKLKNILPFKKARRDDSGLMGDLFGWAGIAANDDDFSIPGFLH